MKLNESEPEQPDYGGISAIFAAAAVGAVKALERERELSQSAAEISKHFGSQWRN